MGIEKQPHLSASHFTRVLLGTVNGVVQEIPTANDLLPLSFDASTLRRGRRKSG